MIVVMLMLMLGLVLGAALTYGVVVAYWRHAEVPGVHRLHDEGPRSTVSGVLRSYWAG